MRERPGTVIFKEFSVDEGEPYYPVPNPDNQQLFEKYRALAAKEEGVLFVGRLASYKCACAHGRLLLAWRHALSCGGLPCFVVLACANALISKGTSTWTRPS